MSAQRVFFVLGSLMLTVSLLLGTGQGAEPSQLVFACNAENDLYRVVAAGG